MSAPLDYATPPPPQRWSKLAILALLVGGLSGPLIMYAMLVLDRFVLKRSELPAKAQVALIFFTLIVGHALFFSFCLISLNRFRTNSNMKGRDLAAFGLAGSVIWSATLLFIYAWVTIKRGIL